MASINASTSGAGGVITTADNTGILNIQTAGTNAVTVDASQNVGIGRTSGGYKLEVNDTSLLSQNAGSTTGSVGVALAIDSKTSGAYATGQGSALQFQITNSAGGYSGGRIASINNADPFTADLVFYPRNYGFTEAMRINSAGSVMINTTSSAGRFHVSTVSFNPTVSGNLLSTSIVASGGYGGGVSIVDGTQGYTLWSQTAGADFYIRRATTTGAYTGGVALINAATSWSSASDENIKDIIEPIENAIEKVSTLRTIIGKYKDEEEGIRHPFLIAQDVEKVLPEAVSVMHKGEDNECLGLSYTDTIPLLVAAIKEQQTIINDLKARIETLEAK